MTSLRSLPISIDHPAGALIYRGEIQRGEVGATLRPLALADAELLSAAIEESVHELRRYMLWAHQPQTPLDQLQRIKTAIGDYLVGKSLQMVLVGERGEVLAVCGLERRVPLNPRGWEIGYWTPTKKTGRGHATLATQLLTLYAFDLLGADRVQLLVDEGNAASAKVAEKCGFLEEGRLVHVTPEAPPEVVARGYQRGERGILFALSPRSYAALPWVAGLRTKTEARNLLGHTVTGFWS